ncbi:RNA polymerase sigma factor [Dyadobacter sp. CY312]|uniref:RNA polymerase sigma factor n=1 Tax=Dyadobacter sp. CY312 TaxID=2907303 RepID=UPI001F3D476F|nr:sigma-70 family RNA polymerase sigma factor [Dyadobacter sp. CY312]MCE7040460.1 sigma-70 family RNA polymerase sigma factor [Dyadobacter sp. CY312]
MKLYSDDLLLWSSFKNGDRKAYETLLNRYYSALFHYASRFTKNREQAEDCIQDSFVYLWVHRATLGSPENVKFYLFKTIRNAVFLDIKKNSVPVPAELWGDDEMDMESQIIDLETRDYNLKKLRHLLTGLPERQREALYLKYFEESSVDEIAQLMGINRQTAANFLYRGLSYLREHWYQLPVLLWSFGF